jgi:hypothetical protein
MGRERLVVNEPLRGSVDREMSTPILYVPSIEVSCAAQAVELIVESR